MNQVDPHPLLAIVQAFQGYLQDRPQKEEREDWHCSDPHWQPRKVLSTDRTSTTIDQRHCPLGRAAASQRLARLQQQQQGIHSPWAQCGPLLSYLKLVHSKYF